MGIITLDSFVDVVTLATISFLIEMLSVQCQKNSKRKQSDQIYGSTCVLCVCSADDGITAICVD